ncbi:unnamed protein product [Ceutorhynchus assimilis]|uniref:Uncharacterized protein n=1 Tax=Ceutorhynchus assimilis TaxID=467358 RepID=A0A9N9MJS0_9CUCU|nr:unnamed protein product [Ceutorhynchus assimilis]
MPTDKGKCEIMCEKIYKDNNIAPVIDFHVLNREDAKTGQFLHMQLIAAFEAIARILLKLVLVL